MTRSLGPHRAPTLATFLGGLLALAVGANVGRMARAEDTDGPIQGVFITVPSPIDSRAVSRVKTATDRFLQRSDRHRVRIVYDFSPDGRAVGGSDYGPCRDLAEYLLDLQDVTSVAFVRNDVTGHGVLPVLACREVVMAPDARLGDVLRDLPGKRVKKDQRQFYEDVAAGRGRCPAIVLRMLEPDLSVVEGTRNGAVWYVEKAREAEATRQGFVITRRDPPLPPGGLYSAPDAQRLSLCQLIKETRQEVAEAYWLPPRSLREDPLGGRTPAAWRIEVRGTVNSALAETLERRVRRAIGQQANFLIFQIECGGGDTQTALDLGEFLRNLTDDSGAHPVMTVAYVTHQAHDTAVFLALGCTEIVMERDAHLGGFDQILQDRPQYEEVLRKSLEGLAREQGYPALLARGMIERDLAVHRVRARTGPVEHRLLDARELDRDRWVDQGQIKAPGELLDLRPGLAEELGVCQLVVDGEPRDTLPRIYAHYGLDKDQIRSAGPDWLDDIAAFLRHPLVSLLLVMLGIAGLVLELKMPGVGLPAVVSALCFVLYFWAHSQLSGNFTILAWLLFALGLILIGLEVFVVPGFGVTGISGVVLVIVSLALATLVKKPETTQEWLGFGTTLSTLGLGLVGAVVASFILAWYLPHIPWANRLVLAPPIGADGLYPEEGPEPAAVELLGVIGMAATNLRPAGKARFGDDYVDVVAEGGYVREGSRIQVVEIEGNRVVVKEVSA